MIRLLSTRFQKTTTLLFMTIFYCDFVLAAYSKIIVYSEINANISMRANDIVIARNYSGNNNELFSSGRPLSEASTNDEVNSDLFNKRVNNADKYIADDEIGGPTQPEMQSFKSVNSDNMVNLFTGDFSYNIPLLDVGGYPVNLFYQSGISMDQEASWVGLGWNINPGSISRTMRGVPDDFNGLNDTITKIATIKENKTVGVSAGLDWEIVGLQDVFKMNLGFTAGVFHNNYRGWGMESGLNASVKAGLSGMGSLTGGLSINNNTQEGLTLAPSLGYELQSKTSDDGVTTTGNLSTSLAYNTRSGLKSLQVSGGVSQREHLKMTSEDGTVIGYSLAQKQGGSANLFSGSLSFASPGYTPTITLPYTNRQISFTAKMGGEAFIIHPNLMLNGYFSTSGIAEEDTKLSLPAFGYLNYQSANNNPSALLDFNREKEIPYREKPAVPNIGVPSYTYDLFTITGEGTGGMFRAYRGDIGYMFDHQMSTKSESGALSIDLGFGETFHGGVDLNLNYSVTQSGQWIQNNALRNTIGFRSSDSTYEASYFRNPAEKAINSKAFYDAIGGDDVVTPLLQQSSINSPTILASNYLKRYRNKQFVGYDTLKSSNVFRKRDKRTQVISYLNAKDASIVGMDKKIENYPLNKWVSNCNTVTESAYTSADTNKILLEDRVNSMRQGNHISEITVLNNDGRRYVYGLPVYNISEKDVTFSVDGRSTSSNGLVSYNSNDDKADPNRSADRDNYYSEERIPAYAHNFLLTSIASTDYVDVTGDGISDDDLGDAIKINYSKVAGKTNPYGWRAPYAKDSATFNEGLKTDYRDNRGSYVYGQKELWYLNSVESKNMLAVFKISIRNDLLPSSQTGDKLASNPAKCLTQIDLYTKADFLKHGTNARPIKTVHFGYSYKLCPGISRQRNAQGQMTNETTGKLTLDSVWFSYNGSARKQNNYKFTYSNSNPGYNSKSYDRWGSYKNPEDNPDPAMTNAEYPYALQDSNKAAAYASSWTLDNIGLPSGGKIKVTYESDDYAYVQNKRAMQMMQVAGFATASDQTPTPYLYTPGNALGGNLKVFVKVPKAVSGTGDVLQKYLDGIDKIYFKLYVKMPTDKYGSGFEYVPCYADIDKAGGYGVVAGKTNQIWLTIKGINIEGDAGGQYSPLAKAAIQYLRLNLPSKAYPNSEPGDDITVKEAVTMIFSSITDIASAFTSYDKGAMNNGWASFVDINKTLVRLNVPDYKKYGGGLRVKKVEIFDNWNAMTSTSGQNGQRESTYGQEYSYTKIKNINGVPMQISSGVASFEPGIGGEENPWKQPLEYLEKVAPLAPTSMGYTETPLGEGFFPSAGIGYSQVRVKSINTKNIKSANGIEETKFYTTYDFPTIVDYTMLEDNKKRFKPALANFLKINAKHYLGVSQGFKIELNDMNGKMFSQATYPATDSANPVSYTAYYYKVDDQNAEFKHLSNTVSAVSATGDIDENAIIGKDAELMTDMREQRSVTDGNNFQANTELFVIAIIPIAIPSLWYMPQREENIFHSVAMTKIIQRYGILDSVVAIDKSSKIYTKNLLYDSETGDVLLTKTQNEFNDSLYNFTYPAHWAYSGMGPAYKNIQAVFSSDDGHNITIKNGLLNTTSKYPGLINYFESGDEIMVTGNLKTGDTIPLDCNGTQNDCPVPQYAGTPTQQLIWAVDTRKLDPNSAAGIVFMQRNGEPYSASNVTIRIIRSGKRNLSSSPVGSVASMKNPMQKVSGKMKLVIDDNKNVINTGTVVYKDLWKVKDQYYLKDTCWSQRHDSTATLYPIQAHRLRFSQYQSETSDESIFLNNSRIVAGTYYRPGGGILQGDCGTSRIKVRTSFNFDFTGLPANPIIDNASFQLNPGTPKNTNTWDNNSNAEFFDGDAGQNGAIISLLTSQVTQNSTFSSVNNQIDMSTDSANTNVSGTGSQACLVRYPSDAKKIVQFYLNHSNIYKGFIMRDYSENVWSNDHHCDDGDGNRYMSFSSVNPGSPTSCDQNSSNLSLTYHWFTTQCTQVCRSAITQRNINPYITGILGDWRSDKSYVYYGDRQQSDPTTVTDIRKNGAIKDFSPFWSFSNAYLQSTTDTSRWVWNSQITMFNKKGFELENKDLLGRYNSGLYGYNETMPVSVTQNSKYREQFYDGFEDYSYNNTGCTDLCPLPRPVDFTLGTAILDTSNAHTGKYSLKVNTSDSIAVSIPVSIITKDTALPQILSNIQTVVFNHINVSPNGTGTITLTSSYLTSNYTNNPNQWQFYFQPNQSGIYKIKSNDLCDGDITNGAFPSTAETNISYPDNFYDPNNGIQVTAGNLYKVKVSCQTGRWNTTSSLPVIQWTGPCPNNTYVSLPNVNIYNINDTSASHNTVSTSSTNDCSKFIGATSDSSVLNKSFSLTPGSQYWLSTWVKEEQNCLCQNYINNEVDLVIKRNGQSDVTIVFTPKGNIIEGWQRYDSVITLPADALSVSIKLKSKGGTPVYFDDLRIHPVRANMRSFAYDPVNLRLMADLDENNYATFYEYDEEGTLIRVKKETQRGIMTIKETRSYMVQ